MSQFEGKAEPLESNLHEVFRVLYVLSLDSGGTPQTNEDLMSALTAIHGPDVACYLLRCDAQDLQLFQYSNGTYTVLAEHTLAFAVSSIPHRSVECDEVTAQWMKDFAVSLVHIRHSAYQSLGLIDKAVELGIPVVYSFHDFYTVCPSVKLLDENRRFCSGRCTPSRGECHQELRPEVHISPLKHELIYDWQVQFAGALALCSGFVSTVAAVKDIVLDVFPALVRAPFAIIPHGRDFQAMRKLAVQPEPNKPLRILVPGHIAASKGAEVLMALATVPELNHVEWHVLGTLQQGFVKVAPDNVVLHGAYHRSEFLHHVSVIKPHLGAVLSIWPETWCHTLTELWAAGVPALGFDTGAVGERLKHSGAGWLAPDITSQSMVQAVLAASTPLAWQQAIERVDFWQENGQRKCEDMANDYWQLYQRVANIAPSKDITNLGH